MAKLKATRSILYLNRLYDAGDELPYYDAATVDAWLEAKSAFWEEEESDHAVSAESADPTPGADAATEVKEVKQASRSTSAAKKKAPSK